MLIPFKELIEKFSIQPTGVIHIGGSHAEELEAYAEKGIENMIWIEAIPEVYEKMRERLMSHINALAICACITDKDNEKVKFNITDNAGQSSSIFELAHHKVAHPDVLVNKIEEYTSVTMNTVIKENYIDMRKFNFLNIDIQGAELLALKGMQRNLYYIDYVYLEVNAKELYKGCALISEVDDFLKHEGFEQKAISWAGDSGWGDAFYIRERPSPWLATLAAPIQPRKVIPELAELIAWCHIEMERCQQGIKAMEGSHHPALYQRAIENFQLEISMYQSFKNKITAHA